MENYNTSQYHSDTVKSTQTHFKYTVNHLEKNRRYSGLNKKLKNDIINRKELVNNNQWGLVRGEIKPTRYDKLVRMMAGINHELCDTKVSIDLKRILRLPSTLHYKVSMKCTAINKLEKFDPLMMQYLILSLKDKFKRLPKNSNS